MDFASHNLFPHSTLPLDKNGDVGVSDLSNELFDTKHFGIRGNKAIPLGQLLVLLTQQLIFFNQLFAIQGLKDCNFKLSFLKRFVEIISGSRSHCFDNRAGFTDAGQHDNGKFLFGLAQTFESFQPINLWHQDVQENQSRRGVRREVFYRFITAGDGIDVIAFQFEKSFQIISYPFFVVHHQN